MKGPLNAFAAGNPFFFTRLLEFSIGRGLEALKGLIIQNRQNAFFFPLNLYFWLFSVNSSYKRVRILDRSRSPVDHLQILQILKIP